MSYSIEQKVSGNIHPAIKYMMDSDCIVVFYRVKIPYAPDTLILTPLLFQGSTSNRRQRSGI